MVKIHYLPAKNCVFYRLGFCIYPEVLNPGYNQSFQCTILLKWEEEYDQLLDKAEVFGLELEKVEKIWTKKSNTRYEEIKKCPHFVEGEEIFVVICMVIPVYMNYLNVRESVSIIPWLKKARRSWYG